MAKTATEVQASREIKWSQWSPLGMMRCGRDEYRLCMDWMRTLGMDAKACLEDHDKDHAIYGKVMHDEAGCITEIRFYCNTYLTDEELDAVSRTCPLDTLYVAHK